ncbi:hypothetical protein Amsp01_078760 [Amycolatopsis sp. NBRC 101858]|uniref:hypothetical protein n=1 Tax=Amycolatopsis sp. NBRC 101858 TaxID=3032200 RepID=UPI0024A3FB33|nr:hypothetical protein [Amycolatopsis sp. NBRC 101858]GLY41853.1 hypothetical protein Amsp01_078760 [Amycolatopsis sp. NBRC 101858]
MPTEREDDGRREPAVRSRFTGRLTAIGTAVLLVAYYCGGYVAGRMARFNGVKQGIAVWVWTIVMTVVALVVALVGGLAGMRFHRKVDRADLGAHRP